MRMVYLAVLGLAVMPMTVNAATSVLKENKVTVTAQDAELTGVLRSMFAEAGVSCSIAPDVKGLVTCDIRERPIDEALRAILSPKGYTWRREGEVYSVIQRPAPQPASMPEPPRTDVVVKAPPVEEPLSIEKIPLNFMDAAELRELIMNPGGLTNQDPRTFGGLPGVVGAYPGGMGMGWPGGGVMPGGYQPGGMGYGYPGYSGYPGTGYPGYSPGTNNPRRYTPRRHY